MDNLEFLRALDNDCIDLIAIDPPFGKKDTFTGQPKPPITDAERGKERELAARHDALARYEKEDAQLTSVKDDWFWRDVEDEWRTELRDVAERVGAALDAGETPSERDQRLGAMGAVIDAVTACATENEAAYIALMSVRLWECRRVLKDTGSIYVHCDWKVNSYLRMLMDVIFGHDNFRREIVWKMPRPSGFKTQAQNWIRGHDTLLYYSKGENPTFHKQYEKYEEKYLKNFTQSDEEGPYWLRDGRKRRLGKGYNLSSVWTDIHSMQTQSVSAAEGTGYATQKPLALYQRIIRASSNPGDVVLDLFAGCATTAIAAEKEERQWLACDMAYRASTMMLRRFYREGYILSGMDVDVVREALGPHTGPLQMKHGRIIGPPNLSTFPRQTVDPDKGAPALKAPPRSRISTAWNGRYSKEEAKDILLAEFGPRCWGCGLDATRPNGTVDEGMLEIDHMQARNARDGVKGDDELYNLALLHGSCNRWKGNRLTLAQLREENWQEGRMCVEREDQLVHPHEAQQFAVRKMMERSQQAELR